MSAVETLYGKIKDPTRYYHFIYCTRTEHVIKFSSALTGKTINGRRRTTGPS